MKYNENLSLKNNFSQMRNFIAINISELDIFQDRSKLVYIKKLIKMFLIHNVLLFTNNNVIVNSKNRHK